MDPETTDFWFGAVGLVAFLLAVFGVARILSVVNKNRFKNALSPLAPIINGQPDGDLHKGWMEGRYRGRLIWIVTYPNLNVYSGQTGVKFNSFTIALKEEPGRQDWSLNFGNKTSLTALQGHQEWYVETDHAALRARLENPALLTEVEATVLGWGRGRIVSYTRSNSTLTYETDVRPRLVPTETQFRAQLDLVLRLAEIHAETNR